MNLESMDYLILISFFIAWGSVCDGIRTMAIGDPFSVPLWYSQPSGKLFISAVSCLVLVGLVAMVWWGFKYSKWYVIVLAYLAGSLTNAVATKIVTGFLQSQNLARLILMWIGVLPMILIATCAWFFYQK